MRKKSKPPKEPRQPQEPASTFGPYANSVTPIFKLAEVVLAFERAYPRTDGTKEWVTEPVTSATLPLMTAKVLLYRLTELVASFESVQGAIWVPPSEVPPLTLHPLLTPDAMARLVVTHAELFGPRTPSTDAANVPNATTPEATGDDVFNVRQQEHGDVVDDGAKLAGQKPKITMH